MASGKRTLDEAASTAFTNVYANPDGTWTEQTSPVPFQTQKADGTWVPIDDDLRTGWGGRITPTNGHGNVTFSGGGDTAVATMTVDGQEVSWTWPTTLPAPTVSGPTATYQLSSTEQLVLTASATGFTDDIVLSAPPASADEADFTLPMETGDGTLATTNGSSPDGAVVSSESGKNLVWASTPVAYDSSRGQGGPSYSPVEIGVGKYSPGGLRALNGGGTAGTPGSSGHASGHVGMSLAPRWSWLTSPKTVYPVTIDPSFSSLTSGDTWANSSNTTATNNGTASLQVGDNTNQGWKARTFLHFDYQGISNLAGTTVQSATLQLRNTSANSCTSAPIDAQRISADWNANTLDWANQPSVAAWAATFSPAYGYSGSCPSNYATWDVAPIVQAWASGANANYGIRLAAENESNANSWRVYRAQEYGTSTDEPQLLITYTDPNPTVPSALSFTPCLDDCDPSWAFTSTLTPTLSATSSADGVSSLNYNWQVEDPDSGSVVASGTTTGIPKQPATWTVPAGYLSNDTLYSWRAQAVNGSLKSAWTAWQDFGTAVPVAPAAPTKLSLSPCVNDDCSTLSTTSLTPILTAESDGADNGVAGVTFEVRASGTTAVIATTTIDTTFGQSNSYRVPQGAITAPGSYEFRAVATGDNNLTTSSAWVPFTVVAPSGPAEPLLSMPSCESPCDGSPWVAPTDTPSLSIQNRDSQAATIEVQFETNGGPDVSTTVANVPAGQSTSWTVPSGSLGHDRYFVRAGASNASAVTWTGWQELTVDDDATVADQPTLDQDTTTPAPAPDSANDDEDLDTPVFTPDQLPAFDQGLASEAAQDPSVSGTTDVSGRPITDANQSATKAFQYMAQRYAPEVYLDPGEPYYPESTATFINHAELEFYHGSHCPPGDQAFSPSQTSLSDTTHPGHPYSSGPATAYFDGHTWSTVYNCVQAGTATYYPKDDTRPYDSGNVMNPDFGHEGFTLKINPDKYQNVLTGYKNAQPDNQSLTKPVYVSYAAGKYITYWFFYGNNRPWRHDLGVSYFAPHWDKHQGDWEHISIKLNSNNTPQYVYYAQHGGGCSLKWGDGVPVTDGTHPVVMSGGGSHASYPAGIAHTKHTAFWVDEIGKGKLWEPETNLKRLSAQDWYGYGGAWGQASPNGSDFTGPMGPGPYKSSVPKLGTKCPMS